MPPATPGRTAPGDQSSTVHQQEVRDLRVSQGAERPLGPRHRDISGDGVGRVQRHRVAVEAVDCSAIELPEEIGHV